MCEILTGHPGILASTSLIWWIMEARWTCIPESTNSQNLCLELSADFFNGTLTPHR